LETRIHTESTSWRVGVSCVSSKHNLVFYHSIS
jgi:hypothetical protein